MCVREVDRVCYCRVIRVVIDLNLARRKYFCRSECVRGASDCLALLSLLFLFSLLRQVYMREALPIGFYRSLSPMPRGEYDQSRLSQRGIAGANVHASHYTHVFVVRYKIVVIVYFR